TQHSVRFLLESGVKPDILVCRTEHPLNTELRRKIALFCNVNVNAVIESIDLDTIYDVPLVMFKEKLDKVVLSKLKLASKHEPELDQWKEFLQHVKHPKNEVNIALVGKYVELPDAYKSINEAFIHSGAANECAVKVKYIHSELLTDDNAKDKLKNFDGILVAPGFGGRGIDGKLSTIKFARENKIPFFGICLGMQCCVIEFARNVIGFKDAHSVEMNEKTKYPVIDMMASQKRITQKGGTMRLGAYDCNLNKGTQAFKAYGKPKISERHRHRFEFNNKYTADFEKAGMALTGINPETNLVEIVELPNHPYFVGVQFHPELKSTVENPHPLFVRFIKKALELKN
ncbi:MAG: CTP synthase, partial [Bacteroidetes bacterium]|nr:CTP synthase [Bacteroidota bacterium]